jgi:hypothetical protein
MARKLFFAFFIYIVMEGALRKWVLPEASTLLFLFKDVLLLGALVALLVLEQRKARAAWTAYQASEAAAWLFLIAIVVVALAFSGLSATSLAGFRYYLAVLPILLLHPAVFQTTADLQAMLSRYVALGCVVCMVGLLQFMSPADSWINGYAWSTSTPGAVATFGDVGEADIGNAFSFVRITGTFSYITPFVSYLQFLFFATLGLFALAATEKARLVYGGVVALLFANILMSGSRAPVVICALLAMPFLKMTQEAMSRKRGALLGVFAGGLVLIALLAVFSDVFMAMQIRNEHAGDAPDRIWGALFTPFNTIAAASFFGEGLGTTFLGIAEATAGRVYAGAIFDEVKQDRIGIELGLLCYLFFVVLKLYFIWATFSLWRRAMTFDIRVWALVSLSYQASLLWQIPIYNSVASAFYFLSIAAFVWLRRLNNAAAIPARRPLPQNATWLSRV